MHCPLSSKVYPLGHIFSKCVSCTVSLLHLSPSSIKSSSHLYSVTVGSDDPVVNTAEVDLKTTEVATWAQNMNILYTFTVGLKPIKFTATVVPWEDEVVSGITL